MNQEKIDRINYLYNKSKKEGLSGEEREEQKRLRAEYVATIRKNLRGTLDQISIVEPDGRVTELSKKHHTE